jgi:hypothetical protein
VKVWKGNKALYPPIYFGWTRFLEKEKVGDFQREEIAFFFNEFSFMVMMDARNEGLMPMP